MRNYYTGKSTGGRVRVVDTHLSKRGRKTTPRHRYTAEQRAWVEAKIVERADLGDASIARLFAKAHECGMPPDQVSRWRKAMG